MLYFLLKSRVMKINHMYACYNEVLDRFEIYNGINNQVVTNIKGKYGIEMGLDINNDPVSILIPEPDVLFGIKSQFLRNFSCNHFT